MGSQTQIPLWQSGDPDPAGPDGTSQSKEPDLVQLPGGGGEVYAPKGNIPVKSAPAAVQSASPSASKSSFQMHLGTAVLALAGFAIIHALAGMVFSTLAAR